MGPLDMTGLLVSVRSAGEAELALLGGADVVDVKEPGRGALGAADPAVWREMQEVVGGRAILSAALGELLDLGIGELARQAAGFAFAKIGLAGCDGKGDWRKKWGRVIKCLPSGVRAVPVAYADAQRARSPSVTGVLELASAGGAGMLLIDTFDKSGGGLLNYFSVRELCEFCAEAEARGVEVAVAGSLHAEEI